MYLKSESASPLVPFGFGLHQRLRRGRGDDVAWRDGSDFFNQSAKPNPRVHFRSSQWHTCCLPRPASGDPGTIPLAPGKPQEGGEETAVLHYSIKQTKDYCHPVLAQRPLERFPVLEGEQWDTVSPSLEYRHRGRPPGLTAPGDRSCGLNKGISQVSSSHGLPLTSQVARPKIPSLADPH